MNAEWTPEPWELGISGVTNIVHYDGDDIKPVATASLRNSRRIVACVNGCKSIPQETVESVAECLQDLRGVIRECIEHWDQDRDGKLGKILLALNGDTPGYRADLDRISVLLKSCDKVKDAINSTISR